MFSSLKIKIHLGQKLFKKTGFFGGRDSGNDFGRFLVSFFEGRIPYIKIFIPNRIKMTKPDNEVNFRI